MPEKLKCVVVGDGAVGKTCLLIRYAKDEFPSDYVPTIFDSYSVSLPVRDEIFDLHLYDTAGQEDYDQLRKLAFTDTDVLLVCFSVDFYTSYENVRDMWVPELKKYCPGVPFVLVGTKVDLRHSQGELITRKQGEKLAKELRAVRYVECSALTKENVNEVFQEAIVAALTDNLQDQSPSSTHHKYALRAIPFNPDPPAESTNNNNNAVHSRNNSNDDCCCTIV